MRSQTFIVTIHEHDEEGYYATFVTEEVHKTSGAWESEECDTPEELGKYLWAIGQEAIQSK